MEIPLILDWIWKALMIAAGFYGAAVVLIGAAVMDTWLGGGRGFVLLATVVAALMLVGHAFPYRSNTGRRK
jgi:hypothetical protein